MAVKGGDPNAADNASAAVSRRGAGTQARRKDMHYLASLRRSTEFALQNRAYYARKSPCAILDRKKVFGIFIATRPGAFAAFFIGEADKSGSVPRLEGLKR